MPPSSSRVCDRGLDELRLVEDDAGCERCRDVEQALQLLAHAIDNCNGVRIAALFQHRQVDRTLAVDPHGVVLQRVGVFGDADIRDPDRVVCRKA